MRYEPGQLFCVECKEPTTTPYKVLDPQSARCICSRECEIRAEVKELTQRRFCGRWPHD